MAAKTCKFTVSSVWHHSCLYVNSMGRTLRMLLAKQTYFVTQRCFQARLLMTPTRMVTSVIGGIVAKATHKYHGVQLHDLVCTSNHFHLILSAEQPEQISRFVGWLSREISVRVGKLIGWRGAFFERRFDAAPILDSESLFERVEYLRAHGVKEGLVDSASDWPGLSLRPETDYGLRRLFVFESKTEETIERLPIVWAPLLGMEEWSEKQRQTRMQELTRSAEHTGREPRGGKPSLGAAAVMQQDPLCTPTTVKRSQRARCFASTRAQRRQYLETYRSFVQGLRESYDNLLAAWRSIGSKVFCLPGFGQCWASG